MANTPAWFKKEDYLASKLEQLIASGETEYETPEQVEEAIEAEGFTAFEHFEKFGGEEKTSPNAYFDVAYYLQAKADELNGNADEPRDDWTADEVYDAIIAEGLTPWSHFQAWGWKEGVNPSADFDLNAYFEDKLQQLIDNGETEYETVDNVIAAFEANGIDPITHYYAWGADESLEPKPVGGTLPERLAELVAAQEAAADAEVALVEKLVDIGVIPDADGFDADELEGYQAEVEALALEAQADLIRDRAEVSDADLQKAVADAQKVINASKQRFNDQGEELFVGEDNKPVAIYYLTADDEYALEGTADEFVGYARKDADLDDMGNWDGTEVSLAENGQYTIKQLQNAALGAKPAYDADVAANGTTLDNALALRDAIALYLAADGTDPDDTLEGLLTAIATYETKVEDADGDAALIRAADVEFYNAILEAVEDIEESADEMDSGARAEAVQDILDVLENRAELSVAVDAAPVVFTDAQKAVYESGDPEYDEAVEAWEEREQLIEDTAEAQANVELVASLIEDYTTTQATAAELEEAFGYEIQNVTEAVMFATVDADNLFLVDADALLEAGQTQVQLFNLDSGDLFFFGVDKYAQGDVENPDNNVLEIFWETVGGNTIITVETETFGYSAEDGNIELIVAGVTADQLSLDNGVLSIA